MNDIKVPPFTEGQKKLIEMTGNMANGKKVCDIDDDIDEFPVTNEEWLRSLNTEQLAKFLSDETLDSFYRHAYGDLPRINGTFALMEWLNSPHEENE